MSIEKENQDTLLTSTLLYQPKLLPSLESMPEKIMQILEKYKYNDLVSVVVADVKGKVLGADIDTTEYEVAKYDSQTLIEKLKQHLQSKNISTIYFSNQLDEDDDEEDEDEDENENCNDNDNYWNLTWEISSPSTKLIKDKNELYSMSFETTYDRVSTYEDEQNFLMLCKDLAVETNAIFGFVEDYDSNRAIEKKLGISPLDDVISVRSVYWGNYYGEKLCKEIGWDKIEAMPGTNKCKLGGGYFFTLTDNVKDSKNKFDYSERKKLFKQLKPGFFKVLRLDWL